MEAGEYAAVARHAVSDRVVARLARHGIEVEC
jgi:hypothetical protein